MNGLEDSFVEEIDFFDLDIDNPDLDDLRDDKGVVRHGQYILMAPDGETILRQWFGPLPSTIDQEIAAILEENGY